MRQHADILDESESLRNPFFVSLGFHVAVLGLGVALHLYTSVHKFVIGTPNPGYGTSVAITPVSTIPLPPRHGPINPVANDTKSQIQQREAPKVEPRHKEPPPKKNAVSLKGREERPVKHDYLLQKYRSRPLRQSQVTSDQAPAAVSEMYQKPGSTAGVGINPNSVIGTRFGGYAQALMEAVARHWNTGGLMGLRAPMAIVNVDILRNGAIRNARIVQTSGNSTLDYSALRAVNEASPFPPLPVEYNGGYLNVDFQFQLHP